MFKPATARPAFPGATSNKVEAFKAASRLASGVDIERNVGGFHITTHYPNAKSVGSVHTSLHSVNNHIRSALGAKGFVKNE
jgi:hypothetical protein